MLANFVRANRTAIVAKSTKLLLERAGVPPSNDELNEGIPLFLDQLVTALSQAESGIPPAAAEIKETASRSGEMLSRLGLAVGQVVQQDGNVCQSITELAMEQKAEISPRDFQTLNNCLDEAISSAVTAFGRSHEHQIAGLGNQRVGDLAHEMRNHVNTAMLTFEGIRSGRVPAGGSTARVHLQSLLALQAAIDRSLAEVRLRAGDIVASPILVRQLLEEVEIGAAIEARARDVHFVVQRPEDRGLSVKGDRQILTAALANLIQNGLRLTPPEGTVKLSASALYDRVQFDVEDECGGNPEAKPETVLDADSSGYGGFGLGISRRGAEANGGTLIFRNLGEKRCVFTLDLPRIVAPHT